jgi:hypothetical protein
VPPGMFSIVIVEISTNRDIEQSEIHV